MFIVDEKVAEAGEGGGQATRGESLVETEDGVGEVDPDTSVKPGDGGSSEGGKAAEEGDKGHEGDGEHHGRDGGYGAHFEGCVALRTTRGMPSIVGQGQTRGKAMGVNVCGEDVDVPKVTPVAVSSESDKVKFMWCWSRVI